MSNVQTHHEVGQKPLLRSSWQSGLSLPAGSDVILKTLALKTAVELDLCTAIAEGNTTAAQLSERCRAAYRGVESLCNYLVAQHLLRKQGPNFELTDEARLYLDRRSEHFLGGLVEYMALPEQLGVWMQLTPAVRYGGSPQPRPRSDHSLAVAYARATARLRRPLAQRIASLVASSVATGESFRALNAGASHGMFGVMLAVQNADAEVWLTDHGPVLSVAKETAANEKALDRVSFLPGDIHSIKPSAPFNVVLATFTLSCLDAAEILRVLQRLFALMSRGALLVVVDDVVDESRTGPLTAVSQNLNMLVSTTGGQVYSVSELTSILQQTGFEKITAQGVSGGVVFVARKPEDVSCPADSTMYDAASAN